MYRAVVLIVSVYAVLATVDEELARRCFKFSEEAMNCCTARHKGCKGAYAAEVKDCIDKYPQPTCDAEVCIAKKLGYYGDDGKLNVEAFRNLIEKKFVDHPDLLKTVTTNCLNADILNKGSPEICDFAKMNLCVLKQYVDGCTEWTNEGSCDETEVKKTAELCMAL